MKKNFKLISTLAIALGLLTPSAFPQENQLNIDAVISSDPTIFTQGLEFHNGLLYQSSGLYQKSFLRAWNPETLSVYNEIEIEPNYFAEGLTIIDNKLYLITWREGTCFVYNPDSFEEETRFYYEGEGWGLANNGKEIIMSNGSAEIVFRDPSDFSITRKITVNQNGDPITNINELEYHNGYIYANIFMQEAILIIDERNGNIVKAIRFPVDSLIERQSDDQVLNGIARNPESGKFLITGKLFPSFFEFNFSNLVLPKIDKEVSVPKPESKPTSAPTQTEKDSPSLVETN